MPGIPFIKDDPRINRNGRPPKLSITALVREELEKVPEGKEQKAKELLVKRIMRKAIVEGDTKLIEKIWEYMDGKPTSPIDVKDERQSAERLEQVLDDITGKNKEDS